MEVKKLSGLANVELGRIEEGNDVTAVDVSEAAVLLCVVGLAAEDIKLLVAVDIVGTVSVELG